jgi:transposase-like protein
MIRNTRKHDKEFKLSALNLYLDQDKEYEEIAQNSGIAKSTLYAWLQEHKVNGDEGFRGSGNVKPSNEEVLKLKKIRK